MSQVTKRLCLSLRLARACHSEQALPVAKPLGSVRPSPASLGAARLWNYADSESRSRIAEI
jgi:hypothetical protein